MPARAPVPHGPRLAVKKKLLNQLKALSSRQEGGFVLVEGQAGMGKTALLRDLEKLSMALGIRALKGFGSAIDETTPLRALRNDPGDADLSKDAPLLAPILGLELEPTVAPSGPVYATPCAPSALPAASRGPLGRVLESCGQVRLSPEERQERLLALCVEIFHRTCKRHPRLLLLDNVQWMDEVSWKLVRMLHKDVPELLIVACIRTEGPPPSVGLSAMSSSLPHAALALLKEAPGIPFGRHARDSHAPLPPTRQLTLSSDTHVEAVFGSDALLPLVYASFPAQPDSFGWAGLACTCSLLHKRRPAWTKERNLVRLHPLLEDDLEDMAHKLLDVKTIPPALSSFLLEKSEGNPFYMSEIMGFLKGKGHVKPTDDNSSVEICNANFAAEFDAQFESTGLHRLLVAQLEALPAQEKTNLEQVLKTASALGETFSSRQVRDIHHHLGLQPGRSKVDANLHKLRELRQFDYNSEQLAYSFRSSIGRDVIYTSLTFENRKKLHTAAAELLGASTWERPRLYLAALAHAARAENEPLELSLVNDAAQQAFTGSAWHVALDTLQRGEELVANRDEHDAAMTAAVEALPPGTLVHWEEMRGEALLGDNKPELAYTTFKGAFKKGVEGAGIGLAPPKEEKPTKGLMRRVFGGKKKEKEAAADPSPDAIAGLRYGLRAHSTLARALLGSAADSAADVAASLALFDKWEMKEHLPASLAAAAALPLCVERVLTQAFGVIYLSLQLRRDSPVSNRVSTGFAVDANALKTAKPLLEPQLRGLVEYCGSQGSSIPESVRASAGAERRTSTVGASRPAPAAASAGSPAASSANGDRPSTAGGASPRGVSTAGPPLTPAQRACGSAGSQASGSHSDRASNQDLMSLELSNPTVLSMTHLAIGLAPTVSGADSAGLLKRAADLAKEADDQRMQRICEHLSKLVSGVLKI